MCIRDRVHHGDRSSRVGLPVPFSAPSFARTRDLPPRASYCARTTSGQLDVYKRQVLENDILRATFLLELGGRLWSLLHKPSGRELLAVNPVFQAANLAIRNAWFSGGVEWNIGFVGHSPFTCSPLFAARVEGPGGAPVLRLYEYELSLIHI